MMVRKRISQIFISGMNSPYYATYTLQHRAQDHSKQEVVNSVLKTFHVNNCLWSLKSQDQTRQLSDNMMPAGDLIPMVQ